MTLRSPLATHLRNQLIGFFTGSGVFREFLFRAISGLNVGYPTSPVGGEHHSSIWSAPLGPNHHDEQPGLRDWMRFARGPAPGGRVGEVDLPGDDGSLMALIAGTEHTLLLFDGATTAAGYVNLATIAQRVRRCYADVIETIIVLPRADRPTELEWDGQVVHDTERALPEYFGCGSEGLYLIRPDGYVGFRSQLADEPVLLRYLEKIFTA